jgi:hypothetical protein
MSRFCGHPRRRGCGRCPRPRPHLLQLPLRRLPASPRRPHPRRLLLPPRHRLPPPPHRLRQQRHRVIPHLYRLPLRLHRLQRRVATRGVPLQRRQRTVARRARAAVPGLFAAHHSKTMVRRLSSTRYRKVWPATPAWQGRVSVESAVAPGVVVNTDLSVLRWFRRRLRGMHQTAEDISAFLAHLHIRFAAPDP